MAVVQWNEAQNIIEVNTHYMSGKSREIPFDDSYSQPIDKSRKQFIAAHLQEIFPNEEVSIRGAPWDYALSSQPDLHENTPIGHYRAQVGDKELIVAINLFDGEDTITVGGEVFNAYQEAGINVAGPVALPDGKWTKECEGYFLHLETFVPDAVSFANSKMRLNNRQEEIGRIVGRMYNVAQSLPSDLKQRLGKLTDDVTMRSFEAGLELFKGQNHLIDLVDQTNSSATYSKGELKELFQESVDWIQTKAPELIKDDKSRLSTTFNFIDKMLKVQNNNDEMVFSAYDAVNRGYLPMITKNATYDVGMVVLRVITKDSLYDEDNAQNIQKGIEDFVRGYNVETGLSLTVQEALEAAQNASALGMLYSAGYNQFANGHEATQQDLVDHIVTQLIPQVQRLKKLEEYTL